MTLAHVAAERSTRNAVGGSHEGRQAELRLWQPRTHRLRVMGEDESGFLEFAQQIGTLLGQDPQPPLLVWLHLCNLDHDAREFGHLPVFRLGPLMETCQILRRYVRLVQKIVDRVRLFGGVPLLLW